MHKLHGIEETVRDSQQPQKIIRDMYQLNGTGEIVRDSQQL